ncbi:MAG: response regulator [Bdellovibrionales bacterium]|nr:response regulator [Bdellovibrionales bacterium]
MAETKKRVLIADDEIEIREILKDLLEDVVEVTCVENGAQALNELGSRTYQLLITDYNMPEVNGMNLLKRLNELGVEIPVIWITGRSNPTLVTDAWNEGVVDYLEKPFNLDQVRKSVLRCLSMI